MPLLSQESRLTAQSLKKAATRREFLGGEPPLVIEEDENELQTNKTSTRSDVLSTEKKPSLDDVLKKDIGSKYRSESGLRENLTKPLTPVPITDMELEELQKSGEPIPMQYFDKIYAKTAIDETKKGIKSPYTLIANIFKQNAILGPRQKFKYELFCNVIRFLYNKQYKKDLLGVTRAAVQRAIAADQRLEVPAILLAAEEANLVDRIELRERIQYRLSTYCAEMMKENALAKWRETLENG